MSWSQSTFVSAPDVLFQSLDDESVLLNLKTERYFVLNDSATRMWQLLIEHERYDEALTALLAEFETDEATLRADLDALIEQLCELQLIAVTSVAG